MNIKNSFVRDYWSRRGEIGKRLVCSGLTEQELLFLMPNNVKRLHNLPMTRANGERKSTIRGRKKTLMMGRFFASSRIL